MNARICSGVLLCGLILTLSGCWMAYDNDRSKARAQYATDQAAILHLYRECLEEYQGNPTQARANCEHYTRVLLGVEIQEAPR